MSSGGWSRSQGRSTSRSMTTSSRANDSPRNFPTRRVAETILQYPESLRLRQKNAIDHYSGAKGLPILDFKFTKLSSCGRRAAVRRPSACEGKTPNRNSGHRRQHRKGASHHGVFASVHPSPRAKIRCTSPTERSQSSCARSAATASSSSPPTSCARRRGVQRRRT